MTDFELKSATLSELVARFTALAVDQDQAMMRNEQKRLNRAMRQMFDVADALKKLPGDQRSALLPLYSHPNLQVRLMAARLTLAVDPAAAMKLLQVIADSKDYPQAMHAGMALWAVENGISHPE